MLARSSELDHVGSAGQPKSTRPQGQRTHGEKISAEVVLTAVRPAVHVGPLHRQPIVHPGLFLVDQSALPFAEEQMLQGTQRQQLILAVHHSSHHAPEGDPGRQIRVVHLHLEVRVAPRCLGIPGYGNPVEKRMGGR